MDSNRPEHYSTNCCLLRKGTSCILEIYWIRFQTEISKTIHTYKGVEHSEFRIKMTWISILSALGIAEPIRFLQVGVSSLVFLELLDQLKCYVHNVENVLISKSWIVSIFVSNSCSSKRSWKWWESGIGRVLSERKFFQSKMNKFEWRIKR